MMQHLRLPKALIPELVAKLGGLQAQAKSKSAGTVSSTNTTNTAMASRRPALPNRTMCIQSAWLISKKMIETISAPIVQSL